MIVSNFPPIEAAYMDEFGKIDPDVYKTAEQIWAPAERLAEEILHDSQKGLELMFKAVANVSRARANRSSPIINLRSYLYQSFKHLILAELEKQNRHLKKNENWFLETAGPGQADEDEINKKILINELRLKMDDWTREVFDLLRLGYGYEELVPQYGNAANAIRSKFSKKTARLAREIQERITSIDDELNW